MSHSAPTADANVSPDRPPVFRSARVGGGGVGTARAFMAASASGRRGIEGAVAGFVATGAGADFGASVDFFDALGSRGFGAGLLHSQGSCSQIRHGSTLETRAMLHPTGQNIGASATR